MASRAEGCRDGMEPDMFSQNCSIPVALNVAIGVTCLVFYVPFLLCDILLHNASSRLSFWDRDSEMQAILISRILMCLSMLYVGQKLAYDRKWYEHEDALLNRIAEVVCQVTCGLYGILISNRFVRRGVKNAFALNPKVEAMVQALKTLDAVHLVGWTIAITVVTVKVVMEKTEEARLNWLYVITVGILVFPCAKVFVARRLSTVTLIKVPNTDASASVRKRILAFQKKCTSYILFFVPIAAFCIFCIATPDFGQAAGMLVTQIAFFPVFANIVAKLCAKCSKGSQKGTHGSLLIHPSKKQPLAQWESEGMTKIVRQRHAKRNSLLQIIRPSLSEANAKEDETVVGVSLACLQTFAAENDFPEELTMEQVCSRMIKPKTKITFNGKSGASNDGEGSAGGEENVVRQISEPDCCHCAYADLIADGSDAQGRPLVSKATHFLSYTWSYQWELVLSALELVESQNEAGSDQSFYFIDQFVLNQHVMTSEGVLSKEEMQAEVKAKLTRSIAGPGRVLMLLHPWREPVVLSRAWCLFEVYTAILAGASVQMCFSKKDEKEFHEALKTRSFDVNAVCNWVDAKQATATEEDDKDMILEEISNNVGLAKYNTKLRRFLAEQFNLVAIQALQSRLTQQGETQRKIAQQAVLQQRI
jgi:hypothetical protein